MKNHVFRYTFESSVPFEEVELSLTLAILATECLHGQCDVRLDAGHAIDAGKRSCVIDASTPVGRDLNRLFIGFVICEFGPDSFHVEHVDSPSEAPVEQLAAA